jgi:hypothetical protein
MKLTNFQVLNVAQGLSALAQKKMAIKTAWKITTALKALEPFAKVADDSMKELRNKYALLDSQGKPMEAVNEKGEKVPNTVQIPTDKVQLLNSEMEDFMTQELEIHNIEFKLSDFPETLELEPSILLSISTLITE